MGSSDSCIKIHLVFNLDKICFNKLVLYPIPNSKYFCLLSNGLPVE